MAWLAYTLASLAVAGTMWYHGAPVVAVLFLGFCIGMVIYILVAYGRR